MGRKICQWCVQHEAAQRGEEREDVKQHVMPAPWVRRESSITLTHVLFGANLAVFLGMELASGAPVVDFNGPLLSHWGANFGPLTLSGDWWRLFTYMFLHGGVMHIAFNMWCLWDLGALCESLYGRWTYAAVYLITGVAGGLASVGWNPGVLSVGASGAIFGLAGALIASFALGEFSIPSFALKSTLRSLVFFAGFNLFFGSVVGGIDNACHIGGLVSGLILGALIAKVAPQEDAPVRRASVVAVVVLLLLTAGLGVERWRGGPMKIARAFQPMMDNQPNRAIAQLQAIIRQQPNSWQAHYALGQTYFNQEMYERAEGEFKRVIELQPQNSDAQFALGMVYLSEKRAHEANLLFTQMVSQDKSNGDAHYGLGMALEDEGNTQGALEELKTAQRLGSRMSGVSFEMGQAYSKLKMYDEAIAAYQEEQKKNGDAPDIESALADAYAAKGLAPQAQDARNKAEKLRNAGSDR
ncbi:MAG TPA: rhomboid family intramembrane serine protease [Candidatus Solibacter sp.]|nr:rhomboid family intramembrane serine protease [Candidatus Solibacter sp.]